MHYGWPDDIDIWSPVFRRSLRAFCRGRGTNRRDRNGCRPFYCPINEISFHAWAVAATAIISTRSRGRGFELKVSCSRSDRGDARNSIVDPRARFVHCEPLIDIVADRARPQDRLRGRRRTPSAIPGVRPDAGRIWPQVGGEEQLLDIVGVNYYYDNQWIYEDGSTIRPYHACYKPLRSLLADVHCRYGRPILVAETGTEGDERAAWFETVATNVFDARRTGIPIEGICLYPIINHVGWDDDRDCPSGLLENRLDNGVRLPVHRPLAEAMTRWRKRFRQIADAR